MMNKGHKMMPYLKKKKKKYFEYEDLNTEHPNIRFKGIPNKSAVQLSDDFTAY